MADYIDSFDVNGKEYDLRDKGAVRTTGGTLTGNLTGQHIIGTWLRTTEVTALGSAATKFAVLDGTGWVYYRTKDQLLSDLGLTGYAEVKIFSGVSVAASAWVSDSTYAAYPFAASIACSGVTANHVPEVVFGAAEAVSGNYAPIASSGSGTVKIYAATKPTAAITVQTITCIKAVS